MSWWQWVIVGIVIYSIVIVFAIAFMRGAHVDDERIEP
jgi:hypothetical protein